MRDDHRQSYLDLMDWQASSKAETTNELPRGLLREFSEPLSCSTSPSPPALWILAGVNQRALARLDDQPSASLAADVSPDPLKEDAETQAAVSKKLYVDQCPDKPREVATDLHSTAL
jgi:hypothetical protein